MQDHLLFNPDGPAVAVVAATPFTVATHLTAWTPAHPEWDIIRVRGTKSLDDKEFFDELAAAMQFPYYFGENWNAVWDCITDLNWLKGSSFLIVFDSAELLLSQSDRGFRVLLDALTDAAERWHGHTVDLGVRGRQPITFQSVLACDPDEFDALMLRMADVGVTFTLL